MAHRHNKAATVDKGLTYRKFYEQYGTGPRPFDLFKPNFVSSCQRFVICYTELKSKSHSELEHSALFVEAGKTLLSEGIVLKKKVLHPVQESSF